MIFLQQLINGISLGSIYALIALGYTMVYGIILLINFAHGDILMIGAYCGFFALSAIGTGPLGMLAAFAFSMVICAVFGILIERLAYKPLRNAPRLNSLITAIAVSFIIENLARVLPFIGPNPRLFPQPAIVNIHIAGGLSISNIQIIVIILSAILMLALNFIVNKTKQGRAMRAVSFDMKAASLMGVSVNSTISFTFALGSVLAAAGGVLYASAYPQINPLMGMMPGLKAFVAAVLGGIGSIPGAMVGGFILGIAETLTKGFISSQFSDAISFSILIVVLLIRPAGIMGKATRVKV
ncbi:MAG: branched-chain amino acid ABC transporter permease [Spirochaetaceae bacterium]|jgi:branched-chain amino acid transport system permease protein|nr:branched-chain amino acid ABC transporter permease [Spirochaetaceae bacterium]